MDDLGPFYCQNLDCPDHGKRGHGNLTVISRYGQEKTRRMPRGRTCKTRFSERKGTPLFDARLSAEKVTVVLSQPPAEHRIAASVPLLIYAPVVAGEVVFERNQLRIE